MSEIRILKENIIDSDAEIIVNAANSSLLAGGGVCGAIFQAAGMKELQKACDAIGHCDTGNAVITDAFHLKQKYIIHAVGPVWYGGNHHEQEDLYHCYRSSLDLMVKYHCHSIAFPLISSGIYGYPLEEAWKTALNACEDYLREHPEENLDIRFDVLDDTVKKTGEKYLNRK